MSRNAESARRYRRLAAAAAVIALPLTACAGGAQDAAESDTEVIIYGFSGNWDLWFKDWETKFKEETGIAIEYISGPGATMRQRIAAEGAAKSDVFISTPSDANLLQIEGLLADIPWDQVPAAASIDERFKSEQVSVWGYDLLLPAYNTDKIAPADAPTSWKELADPEWKDRLAVFAPTEEGATRHTMVMIGAYGEDEALDLVQKQYENAKLSFNSAGLAESALATGDVDVSALSLGSAMVSREQAGGAVATVNPEEGAFVMLNSISIMKDAPHPEAAQKFVSFFLDSWIQDQIMNQLGISIAVNSDVELVNENIADILGGNVEDVTANAYFPNWSEWLAEDESGQTKFAELMTKIQERAQQ
jgi:ABC-type Fe3+ transport system substrate-binding protein